MYVVMNVHACVRVRVCACVWARARSTPCVYASVCVYRHACARGCASVCVRATLSLSVPAAVPL